VKLEVMVNFLL